MLRVAFLLIARGAVASDAAFAWAGMFKVDRHDLTWTLQQVNGAYTAGATHYKIVLLDTDAPTENSLHRLEPEAGHGFAAACTEVEPGGTLQPAFDACYDLHLEGTDSAFTITGIVKAGLAIYAEHDPAEFERDKHYLTEDTLDILPLATIPEPSELDGPLPWGEVIAAACIVNVVTLCGVVFLAPCLSKRRAAYEGVFEALACAFAAGALLACAFFLLLFESVHYIGVGFDNEAQAIWRWGTCGLGGFLLAGVLDTMVLAIKGPGAPPATASKDPNKEDLDAISIQAFENRSVVRVRVGVLIGDLVHNLVDGIFLGTAFRYCGAARGWAIATSTIIHEVAQELADFLVLTGRRGRMTPTIALVLNFLSGLSVLIGALITLIAVVSPEAVGMLLSMSAGVYIHVAATDAMGSVYQYASTPGLRLASIFLFVIGAVLIGIVLIDHSHCALSAESAADPHAGHNHG